MSSLWDKMLNWEFIRALFLNQEIDIIVYLQYSLSALAPAFENIALIINFRYLHQFVFPLVILYNTKCYFIVSLGSIVAHVLSTWIKWLLASDRPYWWIYEPGAFKRTGLSIPYIMQKRQTCEATAGNPSSEMMVLATIVCIFIAYSLDKSTVKTKYLPKCIIRHNVLFSIFAFLLCIVVGLTQQFLATHFLHQIYSGALFGMIVGFLLGKKGTFDRCALYNKRKGFALILIFIVMTIGLYAAAHYLVNDPRWSIHKAFNWCIDPYFIRPEHTSTYWIVYNFGLASGFLFLLPFDKRYNQRPDVKRAMAIIGTVIAMNYYLYDYVPRNEGVIVFYIATYILNAFYVFALTKGIIHLAFWRTNEHLKCN